MVTQSHGGNGAVREIVDALLAAKDLNAREVLSRP
jgi:3-deoxy-D-manno-octulosonate 8-phosphate phosphatase KdsC-like HAD superfamily phosphatase